MLISNRRWELDAHRCDGNGLHSYLHRKNNKCNSCENIRNLADYLRLYPLKATENADVNILRFSTLFSDFSIDFLHVLWYS